MFVAALRAERWFAFGWACQPNQCPKARCNHRNAGRRDWEKGERYRRTQESRGDHLAARASSSAEEER